MKTIPFPQFTGGKDYVPFSSKADIQQLMCLYRERIQSGDGENDYALYKTPGLATQFTLAGEGRCRGLFGVDARVWDVTGGTIYVLDDTTGPTTSYGPIINDGGNVTFAADFDTLLIASGGVIYALNSGVLTVPVLPFAYAKAVAFIDLYFVALSDQNEFYFSYTSTDRTDVGHPGPTTAGLDWFASDVQTAEASANSMIGMIVDHQELWIIGNRVSQVFNVGTDANTPFVARQDAVIQQGTASASSIVSAQDSLFWLGRNKDGERTFVRMNGFQPVRVSTYAVENTLRTLSFVEDCIGMSFQLNGHAVIWWTFPTAGRTLCFDVTENDWYEVAWWNATLGQYERHRANAVVSAYKKILVGDHSNGKLYELSPDVFTDAGDPIRWMRVTPHSVKDGKTVQYGKLQLFGEMGQGLADVAAGDPGFNPMVSMCFSDDSGNTYSSVFDRSLGRAGQFKKKCYWNRLGEAVDRVWKFYGDSPTKIAFTGATFDAEILK